MRKLKRFLWILMGFSGSWALFCLTTPDLGTSVNRAPVNVVNAVIVAVALEKLLQERSATSPAPESSDNPRDLAGAAQS